MYYPMVYGTDRLTSKTSAEPESLEPTETHFAKKQ
jgi:hypothetical protein